MAPLWPLTFSSGERPRALLFKFLCTYICVNGFIYNQEYLHQLGDHYSGSGLFDMLSETIQTFFGHKFNVIVFSIYSHCLIFSQKRLHELGDYRFGAGVLDVQYEDNNILLSCGYDTFLHMWDLRCQRAWYVAPQKCLVLITSMIKLFPVYLTTT